MLTLISIWKKCSNRKRVMACPKGQGTKEFEGTRRHNFSMTVGPSRRARRSLCIRHLWFNLHSLLGLDFSIFCAHLTGRHLSSVS